MGFLMLTALFHIRAYAGGWRPEPGLYIVAAIVVAIVIFFIFMGITPDDEGPPRGGLRA